MADKNKMFFGTNKDTYIAADDAGNIILQTEHGSRAVLDTEGIKVGVAGAEPTVLQAGSGGGGAVATTGNEFPEIWLEEVDGDGTKITVKPLNPLASQTFGSGYDFGSKLITPFYMYGGSFEKTVKYITYGSQNAATVMFIFPASTMLGIDPYSGEEVKEYDLYIDYKNTIAGIEIYSPDMYDPDFYYQMQNYPPKLRNIKAINAVVINGESAGIVMCPIAISNMYNHSSIYGSMPSLDISGEDLFVSGEISPSTTSYELRNHLTMETLSRLRAIEGGTLYVEGPGAVDMSNLTHAEGLTIRVYDDPYASIPTVHPENLIIGSQEGEEFFFKQISIMETEIGSITFPKNGKFAGDEWEEGHINISYNPNVDDETFNDLIVFLESVGPKLGGSQNILVTWANNGFNPDFISDPYAVKPDNFQALVSTYPIYFTSDGGAMMP